MRLLLSAVATLLLAGTAMAQTPEAERTIVSTVVAEHDRHIDLLERLVNQNSGTLNAEGVRAVAEMVRAELEPLGFEVRWLDMSETGRAGHLVATHDGGGKNVLLIGHLDTVFETDSPFQTFVREGARATGPGVGDDKGGVVVIIAALRAMQAAGTLEGANITVFLTGDEERPGAPLEVARRELIEAGRVADYALEFENLATENGAEFGTIARRSSSSWTLTTGGQTGHSSGVFNDTLGYGAIYEMARILDAFRRELPEPNLTYNVGVMAGGTPAEIDADGFRVQASGKTNIVAETAVARGDLRTLTPEQDARVRARMAERLRSAGCSGFEITHQRATPPILEWPCLKTRRRPSPQPSPRNGTKTIRQPFAGERESAFRFLSPPGVFDTFYRMMRGTVAQRR